MNKRVAQLTCLCVLIPTSCAFIWYNSVYILHFCDQLLSFTAQNPSLILDKNKEKWVMDEVFKQRLAFYVTTYGGDTGQTRRHLVFTLATPDTKGLAKNWACSLMSIDVFSIGHVIVTLQYDLFVELVKCGYRAMYLGNNYTQEELVYPQSKHLIVRVRQAIINELLELNASAIYCEPGAIFFKRPFELFALNGDLVTLKTDMDGTGFFFDESIFMINPTSSSRRLVHMWKSMLETYPNMTDSEALSHILSKKPLARKNKELFEFDFYNVTDNTSVKNVKVDIQHFDPLVITTSEAVFINRSEAMRLRALKRGISSPSAITFARERDLSKMKEHLKATLLWSIDEGEMCERFLPAGIDLPLWTRNLSPRSSSSV